MIIRKDSVFHGISEEDMNYFLTVMEDELGKMEADLPAVDELAEYWQEKTGRETSGGQVKRFVARLRLDRMLKEGTEDLDALGERAASGRVRDGLIEAARQKLLEDALEKEDSKLLLELYREANEERAREREVEVSRRKAAAAEENARTGRMRLELEAAKSALKLLPQIRELLADARTPAEERIARALSCLAERPRLELEAGGAGMTNVKIQMTKEIQMAKAVS